MFRGWALALLVLASCPPAVMLEGKACDADGGCPLELVCVEGACWQQCSQAALGIDCTVGVGACARSAKFECADSTRVCPAEAGSPALERCNGLDDDCNGSADDLNDAGEACIGGLGLCAASGARACVDGGWICAANGPAPVAEQCNGLDDDCDGFVDDGCLSTIAGSGPPGYLDGPWAEAMFQRPYMIAVDGYGDVFVADSANNRIRAIWPDGGVGTVAGTGACALADGPGPDASFCQPLGVQVARSGDLYVADSRNRRIRVVRDPRGVPRVSTLYVDAGLNYPRGLHFTPDGGLLIADYGANRVFFVNPLDGGVVKIIGSGLSGTGNGEWFNLQLAQPMDAVQGDDGVVYVSEALTHRIRQVPLGPGQFSSTLAGSGVAASVDGVGLDASFNQPSQLSLDRDAGRLLLIESVGGNVRAVGLDGGATATLARQLNGPSGLAQLDDSTLAVCEVNTHWVRRVSLPDDGGAGTVSSWVSGNAAQPSRDGDASFARLDDPDRIASWPGSGYLAWVENRTVRLMYVDAGEVITVAGPGPGVDGPPFAGGNIGRPMDLKAGPDGGLYVTDFDNQTVRVLDPAISYLGTFAGPGARVDATFVRPTLLAFSKAPDGDDLLFVADGIGAGQQLRRFDVQARTQQRIAGVDSGVAFSAATALAAGADGEAYLVDADLWVRRFDLDGGITRVLRIGAASQVRGLALDPSGNLVYGQGRRVLRGQRDGGPEVLFESATYSDNSSIAGLADGPPRVGILWNATSLVIDGEQLFVVDGFNNRVRLLRLPHP